MLLRSSVFTTSRADLRADSRNVFLVVSLTLAILAGCAAVDRTKASRLATPEIRGTWITTTANSAVATPLDTATTMRRLREIGLNTVYVEVWKDGYTQFPSASLNKLIGVRSRPGTLLEHSVNATGHGIQPARDLLQEMLIEAHR